MVLRFGIVELGRSGVYTMTVDGVAMTDWIVKVYNGMYRMFWDGELYGNYEFLGDARKAFAESYLDAHGD